MKGRDLSTGSRQERGRVRLTAVIMATVPLFTLILAVLHGRERFTGSRIVGGLLAVAGIGVLSLDSLRADAPLLHLLVVVAAAAAVAESTVVVKGFPRAHPATTNGVGMAAGALLLWTASVVAAESWTVPEQARTWTSLGWLVIVGSVGLFYLVLFVIGRWTASASAYVLTVTPAVAVALGALLADEPVTLEVEGGAALVLLAVYVGAGQRPRSKVQTSRADPR